MRDKISKRSVDALKAGDSLADTEIKGFVARRLPSGVLTYGLRYRADGKQRWFALGLHGRITPDEARDLAKQRAGEVAAGGDPAGMAEQAIKRVTLGTVVATYLSEREGEFRPATFIEQRRYLERYWQPLHEIPIGDILRKNVVVVIDTIAKDHGRVAADRARTSLSAFFSWAIDRGYCDATPVTNIKARNQNGPRARVLSEVELANVWSASSDDDHGQIVKLLILTGQRKSEIGDLDWSEVDTNKRQLELPPERTKNGRAHLVPLSYEAVAIFNGMTPQEDRTLVFGKGEGGFSGWSKGKAKLDKRLPKKLPAWTLHDIRRSVVTHLHERGLAQPHVVEAIVNHVSGHQAGVAGVYNKAVYLNERRRALDQWGAHIAALVTGRVSNVVPLARSAERA
jgi:integrase